jgi:hypothetical protein
LILLIDWFDREIFLFDWWIWLWFELGLFVYKEWVFEVELNWYDSLDNLYIFVYKIK